jgi:hypothetical protein
MNKIWIAVGSIFAIILIAALSFGAWHLDWFVKEANTNKQAEIYQDSYGRQSALSQAIIDDVSELTDIDVAITKADAASKGPLIAQRKALVDRICSNNTLITGTIELTGNTAVVVARECE